MFVNYIHAYLCFLNMEVSYEQVLGVNNENNKKKWHSEAPL